MNIFKKWLGLGANESPPQPAFSGKALDIQAVLSKADQLIAEGRNEDAIDWLERNAFADTEDSFPARLKLATVYQAIGEWEQAFDILETLLEERPDSVETLVQLGNVCVFLNRPDAATLHLERALQKDASHVFAMRLLASALCKREKYDLARDRLHAAIAVAGHTDDLLKELALAQYHCGDYGGVLESLALVKAPYLEVGTLEYAANLFLGNYSEAQRLMEVLLRRDPASAELLFARAMLRLYLFDFENGWRDYKSRLTSDVQTFRPLPMPLWNGESLLGKSILIAAEQGIGDQIMFASCIADLLHLSPARVILETHERMAELMRRSFPECEIVGTDQSYRLGWLDSLGDVDFYIHAGDLAGHFRNQLADFPRHSGYLRSDPAKRSAWLERLGDGGAFKIGFAWKGGTMLTRSHVRTLALQDLAPLFAIPGITWVSLQFGAREEEFDELPGVASSSKVLRFQGMGLDLDDLAATIDAVDLVVTVCNSNVHVAGALGKEALVLTPAVPEWRYGTEGFMPWYPSVRLIRQQVRGNWNEPVAELVELVRAKLG